VSVRNATELLSDPNTHGLFIGRARMHPASSTYSSSARFSMKRSGPTNSGGSMTYVYNDPAEFR
jgi:hypothetical protein